MWSLKVNFIHFATRKKFKWFLLRNRGGDREDGDREMLLFNFVHILL